MITREEAKYNLHIEMLKQSFQREVDGMTSILLGNATNTAFNFFEKHIDKLEQHIKSLEAQLANTESLENVSVVNSYQEWNNTISYDDYTKVMYNGELCIVKGINNIPSSIKDIK